MGNSPPRAPFHVRLERLSPDLVWEEYTLYPDPSMGKVYVLPDLLVHASTLQTRRGHIDQCPPLSDGLCALLECHSIILTISNDITVTSQTSVRHVDVSTETSAKV